MKSLKKISVKLTLLILLPLAALLYFTSINLMELNRQSNVATEANQYLEMTLKLSELIHETQKERGITAGFVETKGNRFQVKLKQQRIMADQKLQALIEFSKKDLDHVHPGLIQHLHSITTSLGKLGAHRSSVDSLTLPLKNSLAFYTQNNTSILNLVKSFGENINSRVFGNEFFALYTLMSSKEKAGIERAQLNGIFANNQFALGQKQLVTELISEQKVLVNFFLSLASPENQKSYQNSMKGQSIDTVIRMRKIAMDSSKIGDFGIEPSTWFAAATTRINMLFSVEKSVEGVLEQEIQVAMAEEQFEMISEIIITLLTFILVIGAAIFITFSILNPLGGEPQDMQDITKEIAAGNLAIEFTTTKKHRGLYDVISGMTHNLNDMMHKILNNSGLLANSSTELSAVSAQMNNTTLTMTDQTEKVLEATGRMNSSITQFVGSTTEINSGIQSIAHNAEEVAQQMRSMNETMAEMSKASKDIDHKAEDAVKISDQAAEKSEIATLEMKNLQQSAIEIDEVSSMIREIAQQTNLLALNANIEAASAGEAGKGFAVVANEIKELASQSGKAAEDIAKKIAGIQANTKQSVLSIEEMIKIINSINVIADEIQSTTKGQAKHVSNMALQVEGSSNYLNDLTARTNQVAVSSNQLAKSGDMIKDETEGIQLVIQSVAMSGKETASGATQIQSESQGLSEMANQLHSLIKQFQLRDIKDVA